MTQTNDSDTRTPEDLLAEIRRMARADHAHGLSDAYNPYPAGSDKAQAWDTGWNEEQDSQHELEEEVAKLPYYRIRAFILADGHDAPLEELPREDWKHYTTHFKVPQGAKGVEFHSREARAVYPDEKNVRIFVQFPDDAEDVVQG